MTSRRGFLSAVLAGAAAPAVVKASSLMKLVPTDSGILTYEFNEAMRIDSSGNFGIGVTPTKLLLPATMLAEALKILNSEFDKAYTTYMEQYT